MGWKRRLNLVNGILFLGCTAIWALTEALGNGVETTSGPGAVAFFVAGTVILANQMSTRAAAFTEWVAETIVFQSAVLVFGLLLGLLSGMVFYDLILTADSPSAEQYVGVGFWLFIWSVAACSSLYWSGHVLSARVVD